MADPIIVPVDLQINGSYGAMAIATWKEIPANSVGNPMLCGTYPDKTVHCVTAPVGEIAIQGSNDPLVLTNPASAAWVNLTDIHGDAVVFTSAGMKVIAEAPLAIRFAADADVVDGKIIIVANMS